MLFGATWALTTQVSSIRVTLPFADDPYDAVVSVAALLLPLVVGVTWLRSVRQRAPDGIPAAVRARIHVGVGLAVGLVLAAVGAQAAAVVALGASEAAPVVLAMVAVTGGAALVALALLVRAVRIEPSAPAERSDPRPEPDTVDDLVALGHDGAAALVRVAPAPGRLLDRAAGWLDAFAASALGPRRHRIAWMAAATAGAAIAAVAWHAVAEGPWATAQAAAVYGALMALVVGLGLGVFGPLLRIVRPA